MIPNKTIPKILHYCWFGGGELSPLMANCVESWKRYMPDYKIIKWDESNFDVTINSYVKEAYECKKYAFVSDYARMKILYEHGGIYLDTDVELIKSLSQLVEKGPFMGCEKDASAGLGVAPGLGMAAYPGMAILKEYINLYDSIHYLINGQENTQNIVHYSMDILKNHGLKFVDDIQVIMGDLQILPKKYLCPKDYDSGELYITPETYSIHHYSYSWADKHSLTVIERKRKIFKYFSPKTAQVIFDIYNHLCKLFGK